ncbi:homoserine dehydrogenase [Pseudochryseolinea flava]|uniref:homoserine dehydrogenase n=1 Tax=Pseudochryseolinea flava TaxID=2059302 RepID=UPI001402CA70|nr:homoserine dehydrogenase [Pseudochryseolinea flava]
MKKRLLSLKEDIRVAVIGCGRKGKGIIYQVFATPGMRPVVIVDHHIEKAVACAKWLNRDYEIVRSLEGLDRAIERGRLAVTDNAQLVVSSELINVMVECTDSIAEGGAHALKALQHHQHVVMMNAKADLMYGPLLLQVGNEQGVVYSTCDGTPAAALQNLIDEIDLWGLDIVLAGAFIPNFDNVLPTLKIVRETDRSQHGHHINTDDIDTDIKIQMAILANSISGKAATQPTRVAHTQKDVITAYDLHLVTQDIVPMVDCIPSGESLNGIAVVAHTDLKFQQELLRQQGLGEGPFYVFHRPYVAGHIESTACMMEAYFNGTARLHPRHGMKMNVFSYAKKDLKRGDILDGMNGEKTIGRLERIEDHQHYAGLPICISEGLKLRADVAKNKPITLDDVSYDADQLAFSLYFRALQANTQKVIPNKRARVVEENLPYIISM